VVWKEFFDRVVEMRQQNIARKMGYPFIVAVYENGKSTNLYENKME
jgi:hypothetical protein